MTFKEQEQDEYKKLMVFAGGCHHFLLTLSLPLPHRYLMSRLPLQSFFL
jgi:hypothetical protein